MEISEIIKKITDNGVFLKVQRITYLPYKMEIALQVVEAIGKARNSKFTIDNENRFVFENLVRWVHADPEFKCIDPITKNVIPGRLDAGIYIAGNTGSGKSWALEIMSAYCLIDNVKVTLGGAKRVLNWPCLRTDTICDEYSGSGIIEKYKKMPVMAIQDLGAEPIESMYMGNRLNVMQQILEYRGDQTNMITLITSNLPINHETFIKRYEDRVSSRLNEMCNYYELKGNDRRKQL
jgi:DNA replication protein DnaC